MRSWHEFRDQQSKKDTVDKNSLCAKDRPPRGISRPETPECDECVAGQDSAIQISANKTD